MPRRRLGDPSAICDQTCRIWVSRNRVSLPTAVSRRVRSAGNRSITRWSSQPVPVSPAGSRTGRAAPRRPARAGCRPPPSRSGRGQQRAHGVAAEAVPDPHPPAGDRPALAASAGRQWRHGLGTQLGQHPLLGVDEQVTTIRPSELARRDRVRAADDVDVATRPPRAADELVVRVAGGGFDLLPLGHAKSDEDEPHRDRDPNAAIMPYVVRSTSSLTCPCSKAS